MSAYIVCVETIDRVVSLIRDVVPDWKVMFAVSNEVELGQKLWDLNTEAVNVRYRGTREPEPEYTEFNKVLRTDVQQYKSLQCFIYQCSEDGIDVEYLEEIASALAESIVSKLPEYDRAPWQ